MASFKMQRGSRTSSKSTSSTFIGQRTLPRNLEPVAFTRVAPIDSNGRGNRGSYFSKGKNVETPGRSLILNPSRRTGTNPLSRSSRNQTTRKYMRKEVDKPVQERNFKIEIRNGIFFFIVGTLYVTLPLVIMKYAFGLELTCTYDEDDIERCNYSSSWVYITHSILRFFNVVTYVPWFVCGNYVSCNPDRTLKLGRKPLFFVLVAFAGSFLPTQYMTPVAGFPVWCGIFSGRVTQGKAYHRGGAYFLAFLATQFFTLMTFIFFFGSHINSPFVFGFNYTILIPIVVQLNQGLTVLVGERLSKILSLNAQNINHIMFLVKYQMTFLTALKLCTLLQLLLIDSNPAPTLVFNIVLEILGRNQIWRMGFRKLRAICNPAYNSKRQKKLSLLSSVALSSEVDMEYQPFTLIVLIQIFRSPLLETMMSPSLQKDADLSIRESSILFQPWENILYLFFTILAGDVGTILFARFIKKYQLYEMDFIFPLSTKWTVWYSIATFGATLGTVCAISSILESQLIR